MAVERGMSTAEYKAFEECIDRDNIKKLLESDPDILEKLRNSGLVSAEIYEKISSKNFDYSLDSKTEKVFLSVRDSIKVDKTKFDDFHYIVSCTKGDLHEQLKNAIESQRAKEAPKAEEVQKPKEAGKDKEVQKVNEPQKGKMEKPIKETTRSSISLNFWHTTLTICTLSVLIGAFALGILKLGKSPQPNPPTSVNFSNETSEVEIDFKDDYKKLTEIDFSIEKHLPESINLNKHPIPFIDPQVRDVSKYCQRSSIVELLRSTKICGTRLAIIGKAGAGKTTVARYIAKSWAEGTILERIKVLLHICLGKTNTSITNVNDILKEECHVANFDSKKHVDQIEKQEGEGVTFILDDFDQYFLRNIDSQDFLHGLIKGNNLSKAFIIVTSRTRKIADQYFETLNLYELSGFTKDSIKDFISKLKVQKPTKDNLQSHIIKKKENVDKMYHIPLHMTMIAYLATATNISVIDNEHTLFIKFLDLTSNSSLNEFLTSPNFQQEYYAFTSVCKSAFTATINRQQLLSSKKYKDKLKHFCLTKDKKATNGNLFIFSYPSIQEFLAAFHLAMLPFPEQQNMFIQHKNDFIFKDSVWKFFFGLVEENTKKKLLGKSNGEAQYRDCCEINKASESYGYKFESGNYVISNPCEEDLSVVMSSLSPLPARCNMDRDGGGWMVLMRRTAASSANNPNFFHKTRNDYVEGFGDFSGEFWYGLRNMHCLTSREPMELEIELSETDGTEVLLSYGEFAVNGPGTEYTLYVSDKQNDEFDYLATQNGMKFTTIDKDFDNNVNANCAVSYGGGWWYDNCGYAYLTHKNHPRLLNNTFIEYEYVEMRVRPKACHQSTVQATRVCDRD